MSQQFKLAVDLKKKEENQPVHFKVDGGRFNAEKTLKLNVNTTYNCTLTFKPPQTIQNLTIQGAKCTPEEKRDENSAVYAVPWTTDGLDVNKKGNRQQVSFIMQLENHGTLKFVLQCKFYGERESNHSHWGTPLSVYELDCRVPSGATYVDVLKETLR